MKRIPNYLCVALIGVLVSGGCRGVAEQAAGFWDWEVQDLRRAIHITEAKLGEEGVDTSRYVVVDAWRNDREWWIGLSVRARDGWVSAWPDVFMSVSPDGVATVQRVEYNQSLVKELLEGTAEDPPPKEQQAGNSEAQ